MRSKEAQVQINAPKLFRRCITMQMDHNPKRSQGKEQSRSPNISPTNHAFHLLRPKVNMETHRPQRRKHVIMSTGSGLQSVSDCRDASHFQQMEKGGLFISSELINSLSLQLTSSSFD